MKKHINKDKIKQKIDKDFSKKSVLDIFIGKDQKNKKSSKNTDDNMLESEQAVIVGNQECLRYNKSKWFFYQGRISRVQFLAYFTFWGLIVTAFYIIFALTVGLSALNPNSPDSIGLLGGFIVLIINCIAMYALGTLHSRRLHDLNFSGFFVVLLIIPIINILLTIVLAIKQGETESNRFGRQPKPFTAKMKGFAYAGPLMYLITISSLFLVPLLFLSEPEEQVTQEGLVNIEAVSNQTDGEVSFTASNTNVESDSDDDITTDEFGPNTTNITLASNFDDEKDDNTANKEKTEVTVEATQPAKPEINLPMSDEAWQDVSTHTDPDFEDIDGFLSKEKVYVER